MLNVLILLAALVHPVLRDTKPVVGTILQGSSITFVHEDMSTTSCSVSNFLEHSNVNEDAADPARELTSEWVDARGVTHRVRTLGRAGASPRAVAREHADQVEALQEVFPPRPVVPG